MKKKIIVLFMLQATIAILFIIFYPGINTDKNKAESQNIIRIGIVKNSLIQDIETNYYKTWLEEKSGLKLEFIIFPERHTIEYLDIMFESENREVDAFFSFPWEENIFLTHKKLMDYGQKGYILPLNTYINQSEVMEELFETFSPYDLKRVLTAADGNMYYMPGLDTSYSEHYPSMLWMNSGWLKDLGYEMPRTIQELEEVLEAFKKNDPNHNGLQDELPLVGCIDSQTEQAYHYIINAFIYNDPKNTYLFIEDGKVKFAPITKEWQEAMKYLHRLYAKGLLDPIHFSINKEQLVQLANDPRDLVGAFTSSNIATVLLQNSPEIRSNFICVPPIKGPEGITYTAVNTPLPSPNGIITSACNKPEEVFELFELMMSEEAFLIGRFGEKGVDWEYAKPGDIAINRQFAAIRINNYLKNSVQNKHLLEIGPFISYAKYSDNIIWNGFQVDQEYINFRGYDQYKAYIPKEYIKTLVWKKEDEETLLAIRHKIDSYTQEMLQAFITGDANPYEYETWEWYVNHYKKLELEKFLDAAQQAYEELIHY